MNGNASIYLFVNIIELFVECMKYQEHYLSRSVIDFFIHLQSNITFSLVR